MFNFKRKKKNFVAMEDILQEHLKQLNEKKESMPQDVFDITRFSIEEFISCFKSMQTLIKSKDYEGCLKISRPILETSANIRYIFKGDAENRAKNFKIKSVKNLSDRMSSLSDEEYTVEIRELNDYFQEILKDYVPEKNIREKFKEAQMEETYLRSYKRLSEFVHPVYKTEKIDFEVERPYTTELKRTVEVDTCLITLEALKDICVKYDLDGTISMIDNPGYKALILFATNPKKAKERQKTTKGQYL